MTAAAFLLAACGSKTDSAQVASLAANGSADATTTATTALSQADTQKAMLSFASCMRDHGLDMADPTFDANGNVQGGFIRGGANGNIDPRSTEFQTANDACSSLLQGAAFGGGPGGGRFDRTAIQEAFNSFTKCLRGEGLQADDITLGNGPGGGRDGRAAPAGGGATATTATGGSGGSRTDGSGGSDGSGGTGTDGSGGTGTDGSGGSGGFRGAPGAGGPPPGAPGGPGSAGFNPTDRIIQQLNLDATDTAVRAAVEKCQPVLQAAFNANGSTTTTTAKSQ